MLKIGDRVESIDHEDPEQCEPGVVTYVSPGGNFATVLWDGLHCPRIENTQLLRHVESTVCAQFLRQIP